MEAFQERVIEEKKDLDHKIEKLHKFMMLPAFEKLQQDERDRMERQHIAMCQYSGILGERIGAFNGVASA